MQAITELITKILICSLKQTGGPSVWKQCRLRDYVINSNEMIYFGRVPGEVEPRTRSPRGGGGVAHTLAL